MRASGVLIGAVALASCGGGTAAAPTAVAVASVVVQGAVSAIVPGTIFHLNASFTPAGGARRDCSADAVWRSSAESVVRAAPGGAAGDFLAMRGGDAQISATCEGTTGSLAIRVDNAARWPLLGTVFAAPDGPPIANAALSLGGAPPVTTDAAGRYMIIADDPAMRGVTVSASGYQTRQTSLGGGDARTIDIDLLGTDPAFPFRVYRMMARNAYEKPATAATVPIRRWTTAPNVFIWTTWKDSGLPVANVEWYAAEIRRVVPQLTGGRLTVDRVEWGPANRPLTPGWINVQFDRSGNWSLLGENPGWLQFGGDHTCNSYAVIHEFGHAMGYWHSDLVPSVMGGGPGTCTEINLWPAEIAVAKAMYARPPGNMDPDRDPDGYVPSLAPAPGIKVTCDRFVSSR